MPTSGVFMPLWRYALSTSRFSGVSSVARKIASGFAARTFCICASADTEPAGSTSSLTTWMPVLSNSALNALAVAWLIAELSDRSATRL